MNKATFNLFVEVVAAISHRDTKFKTARHVVIEGLDLIIKSSVVDRFFALKVYDREQHHGSYAQFFQFDGEEKQLVRETRELLQEQSGIKVSTQDVIMLAMLTTARAADIKTNRAK
ncbi:MAG: hypothetical protein ACRYG4_03560 [Janthinobacterium lividum]